MAIDKNRARAIVFFAGLGVLGLAACMDDAREARLMPTTTPGYGLFYMDEGASTKLAYGAPNSDDVSLMMQCAKGSRMVEISDLSRGGSAPTLTLASEGRKAELKATADNGDGTALVTARAAIDAAPLQAFRRSGRIDVGYAGARYGIVANTAERCRDRTLLHRLRSRRLNCGGAACYSMYQTPSGSATSCPPVNRDRTSSRIATTASAAGLFSAFAASISWLSASSIAETGFRIEVRDHLQGDAGQGQRAPDIDLGRKGFGARDRVGADFLGRALHDVMYRETLAINPAPPCVPIGRAPSCPRTEDGFL